jgi:hypothetical protein
VRAGGGERKGVREFIWCHETIRTRWFITRWRRQGSALAEEDKPAIENTILSLSFSLSHLSSNASVE